MLSFAAMVLLAFEPAELELRWEAPAECPAQAEVATMVTECGPLVRTSALTGVRAVVVREPAGWNVDLEFTTAEGTRHRRLPPQPTCAEAASAAAFVIAIAAEAPTPDAATDVEDAVQDRDEVAPAADEVAPAADEVAPEADEVAPEAEPDAPLYLEPVFRVREAPPKASTKPRLHPSGLIFAEVGVAWNQLPRAGVAAAGGVGLQWRRLVLRGVASFLPPQDLHVEQGRLRFAQWVVGALVGPRWSFPRARLELELVGGFEAGQVTISSRGGSNVEQVRHVTGAWLVVPALAVSPVRWLALGVRAYVVGALVRPRYRSGAHGTLYQPGWIGLRGAVFLEFRFP